MAEYNPSKIIKDGNTYNFRDDTKIPLTGSNQISGSLIPATDNSIDIGSSTNNIKMLYTKGITIDGTQFLPSDYATLSGLSTVATSGNYNDLSNKPTIPSKTSDLTNDSGFITEDNTKIPLAGSNAISGSLIPATTSAIDLGSSTKKWKSLNGINPGALSLPISTYINVDTTNWDLTCQNGLLGSFTPTADGWLMLHIANSGTSEVNFWIISGVIRINNKSTLSTSSNNNFNLITIPVKKDVTYNIFGNASEYVAGRSIAYCRFMPCQGNI